MAKQRFEYSSKFETANDCIKKLRNLSRQVPTYAEYIKSWLIKDATERNLHKTIEAIIDIGKMIVADKGLKAPESNREAFYILAENDLFPVEYLNLMDKMIGMRNVIVHGYDKVEDNIVYGVLKKNIKDINKITAYLRKISL
ncbi:hypothetical protein JZK55_18270 [Dissulfurispira thermophila]|uniref:DUF86 domain-containing protein n=2 Tax=root TaxID=1 RepID=A0A7G1H276_9BACT|nr:DUF86 domain-containing protein [Dissulfurispira thermophila]BCB96905.1 hypothetical protein JZK55_18270 [Dissulfurispira thermophila]